MLCLLLLYGRDIITRWMFLLRVSKLNRPNINQNLFKLSERDISISVNIEFIENDCNFVILESRCDYSYHVSEFLGVQGALSVLVEVFEDILEIEFMELDDLSEFLNDVCGKIPQFSKVEFVKKRSEFIEADHAISTFIDVLENVNGVTDRHGGVDFNKEVLELVLV